MTTVNNEFVTIFGSYKENVLYGKTLEVNTFFDNNVNVSIIDAEITGLNLNHKLNYISFYETIKHECIITNDMKEPYHFLKKLGKDVIESVSIKDGITTFIISWKLYDGTDLCFNNFPFKIPKITDIIKHNNVGRQYTLEKDTVVQKITNAKKYSVSYLGLKCNYCKSKSNYTQIHELLSQYSKDIIETITVEGKITTVIFTDKIFSASKGKIWFDFISDCPDILVRPLKYNPKDASWRTLKFIKEVGKSFPDDNLYRYTPGFLNCETIKIFHKNSLQSGKLYPVKGNKYTYKLDGIHTFKCDVGCKDHKKIVLYIHIPPRSYVVGDFDVKVELKIRTAVDSR